MSIAVRKTKRDIHISCYDVANSSCKKIYKSTDYLKYFKNIIHNRQAFQHSFKGVKMSLVNHLIIALVASDLDKIPVKMIIKDDLQSMLQFLENEVHPSEHLLDTVIIHNSVLNKTSSYSLKEFFSCYTS